MNVEEKGKEKKVPKSKKVYILMLRHKFIFVFCFLFFVFCSLAWTQATGSPEDELSKFKEDIRKEIRKSNYRIIKAIEKSTNAISESLLPNEDSLRVDEVIAQIKELKDIASRTKKFENHLGILIGEQETLRRLLISIIGLILVTSLGLLLYLKSIRKKSLPSGSGFSEELITTMNKIEKSLRLIPDALKLRDAGMTHGSSLPEDSQAIYSRVSNLHKSGHTQEEIAKELGIGKGEVEFILNLYNKGYKGESQTQDTK